MTPSNARVLGLLLFWVVFEFADPLGLDTAARTAVEAFISATSTPFHGLADDPTSGEIAVVELTLDRELWPVPISRHADILTTIIDAKPKALFVDIRFLERLPGQRLEGFDAVLHSAAEQHIPILFARGRADWAELPEPLAGHGTLNAWDGGPDSYPLLIHPGRESVDQASHAQPTAAYDLYTQLCAAGGLPGRCTGAPKDASFTRTLHVQWGSTPDPLQNQISQGCRTSGRTLERLGESLAYGAASLFRVTQSWALQPCRPFLTMRAKDLDQGLAGASGLPASTLLAGRVVFYGVAIEGDHDTVTAPVLGVLPGVQQHAAAFENLLAYGSGYYHEPKEQFKLPLAPGRDVEVTTVEVVQLVLWIVFLIVLTAGWLDERKPAPATSPRGRRLAPSRRMVAASCLASGACALLIDLWQSGRPLSSMPVFAGLYLMLAAVTFAAFQVAGGRGYLRHTLVVTVLAAWGFVVNGLWWHLPAAEWLGFVVLYLAIKEAVDAEEGSLASLFTGGRVHTSASGKGSTT